MTGKGDEAIKRSAERRAEAQARARGLDTGLTVFGYLIAGMLAYGGIGWLIGRAVHVALLFPFGMLVGLAISIGFIIYRYGRGGTGMIPPRDRGVPGGRPPGLAREGDDR
jgi:ATP synthase protein I